MRIAMISEHASPAALLGGEDSGGQNVYVDEISRQLATMGFQVDIYTRRTSVDAPKVQPWAPGVRIVNLRAGPAWHIPKDELWPLMPAFCDELLRFIAREGVRYDVVQGNFWMSGWVATEVQRELGIPAVQLFHALGATKRLHQGKADTSPSGRLAVERSIVRDAERVIATCPNEVKELVMDYGATSDRLAVIPLGVDSALFKPVERSAARRELHLNVNDRLIVYVGRIVPRKDVRNVIQALAILGRVQLEGPTCKLVIVGGESEEPDPIQTPEIGELQRLAARLNVEEFVMFAGKRTRNELRQWYGAGDVVVTTPWYEPFGLTPLEAMACARPVVGSDVGGIAFTVVHGETGLLVSPRSPERLAEAFRELLSDPERCTHLGLAARQRVETSFSWSRVAEQTAALYREVAIPVRLLVPSSRQPQVTNRATAGA